MLTKDWLYDTLRINKRYKNICETCIHKILKFTYKKPFTIDKDNYTNIMNDEDEKEAPINGINEDQKEIMNDKDKKRSPFDRVNGDEYAFNKVYVFQRSMALTNLPVHWCVSQNI